MFRVVQVIAIAFEKDVVILVVKFQHVMFVVVRDASIIIMFDKHTSVFQQESGVFIYCETIGVDGEVIFSLDKTAYDYIDGERQQKQKYIGHSHRSPNE